MGNWWDAITQPIQQAANTYVQQMTQSLTQTPVAAQPPQPAVVAAPQSGGGYSGGGGSSGGTQFNPLSGVVSSVQQGINNVYQGVYGVTPMQQSIAISQPVNIQGMANPPMQPQSIMQPQHAIPPAAMAYPSGGAAYTNAIIGVGNVPQYSPMPQVLGSQGMTLNVALGDIAQQQVKNINAVVYDPVSGGWAGYTTPYGHSITNIVTGGGAGSLQSGKFTVGEGNALTPVLYTQSGAYKGELVPGANVAAANMVLSNPEAYSHTGAERYGGIVAPLLYGEAGKLRAGVDMMGVYPAASGNLANLVSQQGVNQPKSTWSEVPWNISPSTQGIFSIDTSGKLTAAGATDLLKIGIASTPLSTISMSEATAKTPFLSVNAPSTRSEISGKDWNPFVAGASKPTGLISEGLLIPNTTLAPSKLSGAASGIEMDTSRGFFAGLLPNISDETWKSYTIANKSRPYEATGELFMSGVGGVSSTLTGVLSAISGGITPKGTIVEKGTPATITYDVKTDVTTTGGNQTISDMGKWIDTNRGNIDPTDIAAVTAFNERVGIYNLMQKENPVVATTTTTKTPISSGGTPDRTYEFGEWSKFVEGSGRVVRALTGQTLEKQEMYFNTQLKNAPGIAGEINRGVYYVGTELVNKPAALAPAAIQGAIVLTGVGLASGITATAATGTSRLAPVAEWLVSPTGSTVVKGVAATGLTALYGWGVTEGGTATGEKTKENIYRSVPTLAAMYGGAGGFNWVGETTPINVVGRGGATVKGVEISGQSFVAGRTAAGEFNIGVGSPQSFSTFTFGRGTTPSGAASASAPSGGGMPQTPLGLPSGSPGGVGATQSPGAYARTQAYVDNILNYKTTGHYTVGEAGIGRFVPKEPTPTPTGQTQMLRPMGEVPIGEGMAKWNTASTGYGAFDSIVGRHATESWLRNAPVAELKWMPPEQFASIQQEIFASRRVAPGEFPSGATPSNLGEVRFNRGIHTPTVEELKGDFMNPENRFNPFVVERTSSGGVKDFQEGRHRAVAAIELGIKSVPVWEFTDRGLGGRPELRSGGNWETYVAKPLPPAGTTGSGKMLSTDVPTMSLKEIQSLPTVAEQVAAVKARYSWQNVGDQAGFTDAYGTQNQVIRRGTGGKPTERNAGQQVPVIIRSGIGSTTVSKTTTTTTNDYMGGYSKFLGGNFGMGSIGGGGGTGAGGGGGGGAIARPSALPTPRTVTTTTTRMITNPISRSRSEVKPYVSRIGEAKPASAAKSKPSATAISYDRTLYDSSDIAASEYASAGAIAASAKPEAGMSAGSSALSQGISGSRGESQGVSRSRPSPSGITASREFSRGIALSTAGSTALSTASTASRALAKAMAESTAISRVESRSTAVTRPEARYDIASDIFSRGITEITPKTRGITDYTPITDITTRTKVTTEVVPYREIRPDITTTPERRITPETRITPEPQPRPRQEITPLPIIPALPIPPLFPGGGGGGGSGGSPKPMGAARFVDIYRYGQGIGNFGTVNPIRFGKPTIKSRKK